MRPSAGVAVFLFLTCSGLAAAAEPQAAACTPTATSLCLSGGRFSVSTQWRTSSSGGAGQAIALTSDTGYFWFFDKSNVEVVVKVLDACSFSNQFWVFAAGLTDVDVDMTVTEVATGKKKVYHNPSGTAFLPIQDTNAFACIGGSPAGAFLPERAAAPDAQASTALLLNNRYKVEASWRTNNASGVGYAVPITGDTGYFWFFSDTNVEVVLKVLNACTFNERFWVFAGGLTDVAVTLKVTDTVTGTVKTYSNAQGTAFQPVQDTSAFQTCLQTPAFAMPTSSGDPLLLQAITAAGDRMQYFGGKTSTGNATDVREVDVHLAGGDAMSIALDAQGRPIRGFSSSGVPIEIKWVSASTLVFTATSADGANQVSVTVDLSKAKAARRTAAPMTMRPRTVPSRPFTAPLQADRPLAMFAPFPLATSTSTVTVTRCATPVNDALVTMLVTPENGLSYPVYATAVGNGNYQVAIPTSPSENKERAAEICESIASTMGYVCTAEEGLGEAGIAYVCPALAAALSTVVTPAGGAAILGACESFFASTTLYCKTLGASPGPPGAPDLAETLCGKIPSLLDRSTTGPVTLRPSAVVFGAGVLNGNAVTAPGTGPFPNFTISTGGELHIGRFTADPADPDPFQDYVATVEVFCAPPSTPVFMQIVGTDGYTDSTSCFLTGDGTCSLHVPGADAGVVDTVTVRIPNGPSRQITLVF